MSSLPFSQLAGHTIVSWVGTKMALSAGPQGEGPIVWEHPSIQYLQLISIDMMLSDGEVYRVLSQSDDGSGYYGLYLERQVAMEAPSCPESGCIYRTRMLNELPIGAATIAVRESDGPSAVLRVEAIVDGSMVTLLSGEVYERDEGNFFVAERDESILVQVDGVRPTSNLWG